MFYPSDPGELRAAVRRFLDDAEGEGPPPLALIAPHAGYVYSGPVAGSAYALVEPLADSFERVVLLGPCHRVPVRGLAASSASAFSTPLGDVPVDGEAVADLLDLPQVSIFDETHADEHSLEVHLPFLQMILGEFRIVPLVVGDATVEEVAEVIERLWADPGTLVVVSSDLSHYLDYESARTADADTGRKIEALDAGGLGPGSACGRVPIRGLLAAARGRGLAVTTLDLRNSGDTAGPRDQVVGYGAFVVHA
jgi:AmmeMemoRadiSam system protein B